MDKIAPAADAFPRLWTSGYDNQITTKLPRAHFSPHMVYGVSQTCSVGVWGVGILANEGFRADAKENALLWKTCVF